jgi:hypothetical protein
MSIWISNQNCFSYWAGFVRLIYHDLERRIRNTDALAKDKRTGGSIEMYRKKKEKEKTIGGRL